MSADPGAGVRVALTAAEWELVSALRDVPRSPLKQRIDELLAELVRFARDPRCTEIQADGVPCTATTPDCESCRKVTDLVDTLKGRLAAR